jgi:hypothetical protein
MKQKINSVTSDGTKNGASANADVTTSSSHNAKPNVGGSFSHLSSQSIYNSKEIPKGVMIHKEKFLVSILEIREVVQLLGEYKQFFGKEFTIEEQYFTIVENKTS